MKKFPVTAISFVAWAMLCGLLVAEPTAIDVRVISKGAKFVGTSMGGVEVIIRDNETGEILAHGKTAGTTGDTAKIMTEQAVPHAPVSTKDAAVFHSQVEIDEPRQIEVTARGPLAQPQAINTVSATQWIVPGKPITGGDAFLLELPGLIVDVLGPPAHLKLPVSTKSVAVRANVCMMCGCPVKPEGLWDANRLEAAGIVYRDGKKLGRVPLEYAGQTSQFRGVVPVDGVGAYEVVVFAYDPANGNTGVDKTTFVIKE